MMEFLTRMFGMVMGTEVPFLFFFGLWPKHANSGGMVVCFCLNCGWRLKVLVRLELRILE